MQTKQATHTPGPWRTSQQNFFNILAQVDGKARMIAAAYVANDPSPSFKDSEEWRANSRLLAAAPELLEALEQLADAAAEVITYENSPITRARDAAIGAIAKARG